MMLIGFGYVMTFIRSYAWSAISYTLLINSFISQLYILLSPFWEKVLFSNFHEFLINLDIEFLIRCSYGVASVLIAFGGIIGRVGPKDLLIIGTVHIIGYALNEELVLFKILATDAGGSMTIHTYGAYFGLTVCLILSTKVKPITNIKISYISNIFAFIGTLFLWLYWPSFNFALFALNSFEQHQIGILTFYFYKIFRIFRSKRNGFSFSNWS
jgi:ammonium transporter Rh